MFFIIIQVASTKKTDIELQKLTFEPSRRSGARTNKLLWKICLKKGLQFTVTWEQN